MGLFGKPKLDAEQAGIQFVHDCLQIARDRWPSLSGDLAPILDEHVEDVDAFLADNWTLFYFAVAAIACEMQAAKNLLPADISNRALRAAYGVLGKNPDFGDLVTDLLDQVDEEWRSSIATGIMPSAAVPLLRALELAPSVTVAGAKMYDPIVLMAVDGVIIGLVPGWWKTATAKFKIR